MSSFGNGYEVRTGIEHDARRLEEQAKAAQASQNARVIADAASNSSRVALEQLNRMSAEHARGNMKRLADARKIFEQAERYRSYDRHESPRKIVDGYEKHSERVERYQASDQKRQEETEKRHREAEEMRREAERRRQDEEMRRETERRRQETEKRRRECEKSNTDR